MAKNKGAPIVGNPITGSELEKWFTDHLPYRFSALAAHSRYSEYNPELLKGLDKPVKDEILICTIEMAILSCRKFIQFLGLTVSMQSNPPELQLCNRFQQYDVKVDMIGGRVACLDDLSQEGKELLVDIYIAGNRTTAHITTGSKDQGEIDRLHEAVLLVGYLMKRYLYDEINKDVIVRPVPDCLLYKRENAPQLLDKYLNRKP